MENVQLVHSLVRWYLLPAVVRLSLPSPRCCCSHCRVCTNSTIVSGCNNLHKLCLQAPVSVGDRYNGTLDMSYDSNQASRGWDSSSLVNAPVSGAMPLEHATLVQQPLPDDDNHAVEN